LAEGIDGSVEDFANEMNATAASLGMKESHFVNPNGLHDPNHYSSARDLAIVAQALYRDFPEDAGYFDIGALKLGNMIIPTHNGLMGRYPGIDGMKTGFTCPAGFNIVASATQGDRQIIAVVLGYPRAKLREMRTAALLDAGFHSRGTGLMLTALPPSPVTKPPNMHDEICGRHPVTAEEEDFPIEVAEPGAANAGLGDDETPAHFFAQNTTKTVPASQLFERRPVFEPIPVFLGPVAGWTGPVLQARATPEAPEGATVPATAAAYAPTKASGRNRQNISVGASAARAIAEKAHVEAARTKAKSKTTSVQTVTSHAGDASKGHASHGRHVSVASTPATAHGTAAGNAPPSTHVQ
jgi:D-alanyl-D-alanine carboxypeptidase